MTETEKGGAGPKMKFASLEELGKVRRAERAILENAVAVLNELEEKIGSGRTYGVVLSPWCELEIESSDF